MKRKVSLHRSEDAQDSAKLKALHYLLHLVSGSFKMYAASAISIRQDGISLVAPFCK